MAYNSQLLFPNGISTGYPQPTAPMPYQMTYQQQSPVNNIVWIDGIKGAEMYPLPPNSISPPLMWRNEPRFTVKTTDGGGAWTLETYRFEKEVLNDGASNDIVTREDFESFKREVMEAVNGKPVVQAEPAE